MPDLELTSTAFDDGEPIPEKHTADGEELAPAALELCAGRDADDGADRARSGRAVRRLRSLARLEHRPGLRRARRGCAGPGSGNPRLRRPGWTGPSPPEGHGPHRYFFRLYALDTDLDLEPGAAREQLEEAMEGHMLAEAQLMGTYERGWSDFS